LWDDSRYRRIGFGGARGGSKSGGIRRIMVQRRLEYPCTTGLIIRRSLKELEQSHLQKIFEEWPQLRRNYNEQKKKLVFPETNSVLYFGSAPTSKDVADFCSSEYADIFPDEAQEFSQDELERLAGSNRCTTNSEITPKMIYSFMPGRSPSGLPPKGLSYLKRVFIDGKLRDEEATKGWAFLQAFSWDNIEWARRELTRDGVGKGEHHPGSDSCECQECIFYSWPEEARRDYFLTRTDYGFDLTSITDKYLRDAWLYGKWDVFEGQYFPNFEAKRHVISREEARARIKPWHVRWLSGDWGFDHPHCVHWHVKDEHNHVITYQEDWGRAIGETELGQKIGRLSAGQKFTAFPFSWDFGKLSPRDPGHRRSIGQMISEAMPEGIPKPHPAESSPGSRISGWRLMSQLLDSDMWQIVGDDCPKLVECLPSLIRDPKNTEDVLKVDFIENQIGDDAAESARYGLQFMLGRTIKPDAVKLEEKIHGIRQGFLSRAVQPPKPGTDWFSQFGGTSAKKKQ
jgi:Phage terminase large subunit